MHGYALASCNVIRTIYIFFTSIQREIIRLDEVVYVGKVASNRTVTIDDWWNMILETLAENRDDRRILSLRILSTTIHIEITQTKTLPPIQTVVDISSFIHFVNAYGDIALPINSSLEGNGESSPYKAEVKA